MSRCFPYPPPGYLGKGVRGEAVRDPIKLKKGKENPITELDNGNKKRKDKKERKDKKDKKRKDKGSQEHGSSADKHKTSDKSLLPKGKEEEAERSDLTVEHEQPVRVLSVCHSPDSSGRGDKRKLDESGSISKSRGNILRIRLPLQRDKEPDATILAQRCSVSENAVTVSQQAETGAASDREKCQPVASISESVSRSVKESCVADLKSNGAKSDSVSLYKRERKIESLYKALTEDWVPQPLEMDQNDTDDSWLQPSNERDQVGCKRLKSSHLDQPCRESSYLWPCAGYIAEADVYALPYSVPF